MSQKYQNKYRITTNRAKWWDYNGNGLYFVTLCTAGRENYFGKVLKKKLVLSETGNKAWQFWQEIPIHFPFVELDVFIVMPDHLHGVIGIVNPVVETLHATSLWGLETLHATSLQTHKNTKSDENKNQCMSGISPKTGTLSTVIRSYKSALTKWCNSPHPSPCSHVSYQPGYPVQVIPPEPSS